MMSMSTRLFFIMCQCRPGCCSEGANVHRVTEALLTTAPKVHHSPLGHHGVDIVKTNLETFGCKRDTKKPLVEGQGKRTW